MSGLGVDSTSREGDGFRPDLEGFRAIAVALVLLYHARVPRFGGGYVGVDVFFVLSGFLITGLLLRELESSGRIDLAAFYARRARRLLPAAMLVLLATAIASLVILPPLRMPSVTADIASAAAYASNIRFALQATDYLASDVPPSPVLHYWSLGVEEQFYLVWPALLLLLTGAAFKAGARARGVSRLTLTLVVVFVLSLAGAIWLTGVQQPWAFFSLPTRAWELALGGLLAMPAAARIGRWRVAPWLGWAGLGLVLASGFVLDDATPFPGVAALLPTIGSALVIGSGLGAGRAADRTGDRPVERHTGLLGLATDGPRPLLSFGPVRYLGRISYSLYLWHWPVLVLPAAALGPLPGWLRLGLVGVAILLAAASQRWVEEPIRRGRFVGIRPPRVLAVAGVVTVLVASSSLWLGWRSVAALQGSGTAVGGGIDDVPLPSGPVATLAPSTTPAALPPLVDGPVPEDLVPSLIAARDDLPIIYADGCHANPPATAPVTGCAFGDTASATTVVLFGDSHAAQWFPAMERLATEHGWRLLSMTKSACASADVAVWSGLFDRPYTECMTWRERAFDLIAAAHPALVVVANDRGYALDIDGQSAPTDDHEDVWAAGLGRTIGRLQADGAAVVVIGETARLLVDPLDCLSAHLQHVAACSSPYRQAVATAHLASEELVTTQLGATFVDPVPWMCFTDPCPSVIGRFLVYRDTHHMTATYSRALAPRLFADLPVIP